MAAAQHQVAKAGPQPAPKTGTHNSDWVQDPGDPASRDSATFSKLQPYVTAVLRTFAHDKRIVIWDLYNEPGNSGKREASLPLLRSIFRWARREPRPTPDRRPVGLGF